MIYCDIISKENADFSELYKGSQHIMTTKLQPIDYNLIPLTLKSSVATSHTIITGQGFTDVEYCKNWTGTNSDVWVSVNETTSVPCNANEPLSIRATWASRGSGSPFQLSDTDPTIVYGNINSLLAHTGWENITSLANYGSTFYLLFSGNISTSTYNNIIDASNLKLPATTLSDYCYDSLFRLTNLTSAPELPATTLTTECYNNMFYGCTSLTTAPQLPATNLALSCYEYMFSGCTSLTTAPELPATTLADRCYASMFRNCTSLTSIPSNLLPATTLTERCYLFMFRGCTSLTTVPSNFLPATTLAIYCYTSMFEGCTSLTSVPSNLLPASSLTEGCYEYMFLGCTNLVSAPITLSTGALAKCCYREMFNGCSSLTSAPSIRLSTTSVADNTCWYMFKDCSSLVDASNVLNNSLVKVGVGSFKNMFENCTSLTTAPSLSAITLSTSCYEEMFKGCTSLTTAPQLPASNLKTYCYKNMFNGCSSLNNVTCLATNLGDGTNIHDTTTGWMTGVAYSGTFKKYYSMQDWTRGDDGIPSGWTVTNQY